VDVHRARPYGVVVGEVSREVEGFAQQADRVGRVGVERDTRESRQRKRLLPVGIPVSVYMLRSALVALPKRSRKRPCATAATESSSGT
jgi:hypothetical protein